MNRLQFPFHMPQLLRHILLLGHSPRPLPTLSLIGLVDEEIQDVLKGITPYLTCPDLQVSYPPPPPSIYMKIFKTSLNQVESFH